jgi:hypothetical protein
MDGEMIGFLTENFNMNYFQELYAKNTSIPIMCQIKFESDKDMAQVYNLLMETDCNVIMLYKIKNIWIANLDYNIDVEAVKEILNEEKNIEKKSTFVQKFINFIKGKNK